MLARVEDFDVFGQYLDLAGRHVGVDVLRRARGDRAADGYDVFERRVLVSALREFRSRLTAEDDLGDAGPVAELQE